MQVGTGFKDMDTFGNYCQKAVLSLGVSQHYYAENNKPVKKFAHLVYLNYIMHINKRPVKIWALRICERILGEKTPLSRKLGAFLAWNSRLQLRSLIQII